MFVIEQNRQEIRFLISDSRGTKPFSLIHCDLWGKYHTPSYGGCHFFLYIADNFSKTYLKPITICDFSDLEALFKECTVIME